MRAAYIASILFSVAVAFFCFYNGLVVNNAWFAAADFLLALGNWTMAVINFIGWRRYEERNAKR